MVLPPVLCVFRNAILTDGGPALLPPHADKAATSKAPSSALGACRCSGHILFAAAMCLSQRARGSSIQKTHACSLPERQSARTVRLGVTRSAVTSPSAVQGSVLLAGRGHPASAAIRYASDGRTVQAITDLAVAPQLSTRSNAHLSGRAHACRHALQRRCCCCSRGDPAVTWSWPASLQQAMTSADRMWLRSGHACTVLRYKHVHTRMREAPSTRLSHVAF